MKTAAILSVVSAAGVLAAPTEQAKRPFFGGPISKNFSAEYQRDSPWGGAVQEGRGWKTVTGVTKIPSVTDQSPDAGAAAWVGIDG